MSLIPEGYEIIRATEAEIEGIVAVSRECFAEPDSASTLERLLFDPFVTVLCAVKDGQVVAYCSFLGVAGETQVINVATLPEHRGRGIAHALMKVLLFFATETECPYVSLEVRASNAAAIKVYSDLGFKPAGVRKAFYRHPTEDAIVMLRGFDFFEEEIKTVTSSKEKSKR